jgi:hypothetical protein
MVRPEVGWLMLESKSDKEVMGDKAVALVSWNLKLGKALEILELINPNAN